MDTEGTEFKILNSVNLKEYIFLYINLEHNYIEPNRSEIRKLLENNGYLYKGENKWDDDYIHESVIIGSYYQNNDKTKLIEIEKSNINKFVIKSNFLIETECVYTNSFLCFLKLKSYIFVSEHLYSLLCCLFKLVINIHFNALLTLILIISFKI